jgi:class 3 adenylate cyclase
MIEVVNAAEEGYEQPLEESHVPLSERFRRARQGNNWVSSSSSDSSASSHEAPQSFIGSLTGIANGVDGELMPELSAIKDTRRARMFRLVVVASFLCFSVCLPVLIYLRWRQNEVDAFEASFLTLSATFMNSVQIRLAEKFSAVDSLGRAFTSYELNSNESWPLVTIPDFELRGKHVRELGDMLSVGIHPLVNSGMRETWENYTALNTDWFGQAKSKCGAGTGQNLEFPEGIFRLDGESGFVVDDSAGPYLPTWQLTPATENIINLNILSHPIFSEAASKTIATSEATISRLENVDSLGQMPSEFFTDYYGCLMQNHSGEQDVSYNEQHPLATMFFPVFSSFSTQTRQLVGVLSTLIDFEQLFNGALAEGSGGLLGVLDNNCGDIFSFEVNGEDAVYLGPEDFHNTDHGSLNQKFEFASTLFESASSVEVNSVYCPYTLRVYPQDMLYDDYVTTMPVVYSVTIAVVLLFVICVVLSYDCYLHRRMSKIEKAAEASRAIVSSLFPENVRDRILAEGRRASITSAERALSRRGSNENIRRGSNENIRRGSNEKLGSNENSRRGSNENSRRGSNENSRRGSNENSRRGSNENSRRGSNENSRRGSNENSSIVQDIITPIMQPIMQPFTSIMAGVANLAPAKMLLKSFLHEEDLQATRHSKNYLPDEDEEEVCSLVPDSKPIADLFPHCTVLISDIEGFTAWSSEREPEQVFILLETIFQAFDRIARKRDIFKVETIGDSYIAVAGLPDPQPDHAIRMTKYARSCLNKVNEITKKLEVSLGPGTGDLRMRFGLHSGPVTAGVLRGEKSRFQLFGDTVNTASRMERTGQANRIHISLSTAQILIEAGKENWILPRENAGYDVKGHASLQTYWVLTRRRGPPSMELESSRPKFIPVATIQEADSDVDSKSGNGSVWGDDEDWKEGKDMLENTDQIDRQIEWQVDLFQTLIGQIIAGRGKKAREEFSHHEVIKRDGTVLEEISESIKLPKFDPRAAKAVATKNSEVEVPAQVVSELREFVKNVAQKYRNNPFHSFAHAVHVTMSAKKLLSRIVKPELVNYHRESVFAIASDMHDYTYGITSDPLTHFAILFSTLIHDVDHTGVSNPQRNEEDPGMAKKYKERSVAEQNSVDIAWDLLMDDRFKNLQDCLFSTKAELMRFRQLLVNLVMATDIFEREMKSSRESRWARVFHSDISDSLSTSEFRNMKAAIVMEHIIQAADVAHTMQHWKVYVKWNECLFREMYLAHQVGRGGKDPSEGWYKGELWFL